MAPINKLPTTGYVFGAATNPITSVKAGGVQKPITPPIQKPGLYSTMNGLDRTYGQSPVVEDNANAGALFGTPVLRHIAYA